MVYYFVTCLQCSLQVTLTFQQLIHFTDWVVGHAHLVMFGVFSMWQLGVMTYLFPKLLKCDWYSRSLCEWHYWLSAGGILVMFSDLTLAGLFQGWSWMGLMPWEHSVEVSQPFWAVRLVAGLAMFAGQLCFVWNIFKTWQRSPLRHQCPPETTAVAVPA
jgi:cytochrome c oxidase cbb3-type subunit 1